MLASRPIRSRPHRGPEKSWAFYGHLRKGETDVYQITVDRSAQIPWSLLVDRRDAGNSARPVFTLSTADGRLLQTTHFAHSERFYEPFSREQYSTTPTTILSLEGGRYRIAIRMCGTNEQRYTLAIGSAEHFGISEIPYVLGSIHRFEPDSTKWGLSRFPPTPHRTFHCRRFRVHTVLDECSRYGFSVSGAFSIPSLMARALFRRASALRLSYGCRLQVRRTRNKRTQTVPR